jgi:hypothetical protein
MPNNLKADKATVLIEIFPRISLDAVMTAAVLSKIRHADNYHVTLKCVDGDAIAFEGKRLGFAFEILPQDFFLADTEGLKAFLDGSAAPDRAYFFSEDVENMAKQKETGGAEGYFCVRVRLFPMPKREDAESGCGIVDMLVEKLKKFAKKFKHEAPARL